MASEPRLCGSKGGPLSRLWVALSFWIVVIGHVTLGQAQPTEAEQDAARDLMVRGDELYDQGQYAQALEQFRGADAVMGVPTTQVAVARTLRALGRLREARSGAQEVAASSATPDEPHAFVLAREEAQALVAELDGAIPTLQVRLTGPTAATTVVTIDGQLVAELPLQRPLPLDPGAHVVDVSAPGHRSHVAEITLREGEHRELEVTLLPLPSPRQTPTGVVPVPPAPPSSPEPSAPPAPGPSPLPYVAFGLAGVGAAVGAATGIASLVAAPDVKDQCDGNVCPPSAEADADVVKRLAWASNISFGVALVGATVGTIALLAGPDEPTPSGRRERPLPAPIRFAIGPTYFGIDVAF